MAPRCVTWRKPEAATRVSLVARVVRRLWHGPARRRRNPPRAEKIYFAIALPASAPRVSTARSIRASQEWPQLNLRQLAKRPLAENTSPGAKQTPPSSACADGPKPILLILLQVGFAKPR